MAKSLKREISPSGRSVYVCGGGLILQLSEDRGGSQQEATTRLSGSQAGGREGMGSRVWHQVLLLLIHFPGEKS